MNEKALPENDSLRVQLTELNVRARFYTSQLWQVPFAYLGILALVLTQVANSHAGIIAGVFAFAGVLGAVVIVHMTAMLDGTKRAVTNIVETEKALNLQPTAQYRPVWHIWPLIGAVVLATVGCFISAGYYWCRVLVFVPGVV